MKKTAKTAHGKAIIKAKKDGVKIDGAFFSKLARKKKTAKKVGR